MWVVQIALRRPYTFVVLSFLIAIFGALAALRTPTDIFPNINIPVVSVVWTYTGLLPNDMSGRVIYFYERYLTAQVGDIEHIESQSLNSYGVVKIFFQKRRQYPHRARAGDRGLADRAQASAPRHHPAVRAQLQRRDRADPAAGALRQKAAANEAVRSRPELHPAAARDRRWRRGALALRRQDSPGAGRSRPAGHAGAQRVGQRCASTPSRRRISICRRATPRSASSTGTSHSTRARSLLDQINDLPVRKVNGTDHRCARRRLRARGLAAADQPGARQRLARRADDDPQGRRRLDPQRHRRHQIAAAAGRGEPAGRT